MCDPLQMRVMMSIVDWLLHLLRELLHDLGKHWFPIQDIQVRSLFPCLCRKVGAPESRRYLGFLQLSLPFLISSYFLTRTTR